MTLPDFFNVEFEGTASRRTFWLNQLACVGSVFVVLMVALAFAVMKSGVGTALFGLLTLLTLVFATLSGFAIGARRCRELGHSGWMVLVYLVPFAWLPFMLYLGLAQPRVDRSS